MVLHVVKEQRVTHGEPEKGVVLRSIKYAACFTKRFRNTRTWTNQEEAKTKVKMCFLKRKEKQLNTRGAGVPNMSKYTCVPCVANTHVRKHSKGVCRACKWVAGDESAVKPPRWESKFMVGMICEENMDNSGRVFGWCRQCDGYPAQCRPSDAIITYQSS